ncbi:MAG: DJ-1 family protein [Firmicutes bacterium HGW-Firmicutes-1]|jgi:4-methyl-5(b-hydroxyethyl)-thiazole monophosphate biosynthesis|nr:MAG: DJ-1 family protein [Firmicutes bacterium HGW-Firmicutes-1]
MKVAIFLAEGFEEIEAISIIDVLRRGEANVDTISISNSQYVEGGHSITIKADKLFTETQFDDYDMLVLPGGMPGTTNLGKHKQLCALLIEFNKKGKTLGAICAAPSVLGELGILNNKESTCYPGYESQLIGCKVKNMDIVTSNNVITGKGAGVAISFALELLKTSKDSSYIEALRKKMIMS